MTDNLADLKKLDLPFDVDEVIEQCHDCVRKQLKKYEKAVDQEGKPVGHRFIVPCHGIKKNPVDPALKNALTDKQLESTEAVHDIVKFAKKFLKLPTGDSWVARWYQEKVLRCTSKRKVLRIARRCLVPGSMVLMADGTWKPIEKIKVGEYVASRNKKNQLVRKKVDLSYDNGVQDTYKITISNGMSVTCTSNHPLLALETLESGKGTRKVWKSIEDGLSVKTKVVVMKHYDKWGEEHNPKLGALLGYMLTDGYFGKPGQTPKFTNNNIRMVEEVSILAQKLFGYHCSVSPKENGHDLFITDGNKRTENVFTDTIKDLGLYGIKAKRKHIPQNIIDKYDKETQMSLINRMYSGDGGVSIWKHRGKETGEVFLVSASRKMLEQVQLILRKVWVESFISLDERDIDVMGRGKITHSKTWKLRISRADSIENFFENVGLVYGKEEASKKLLGLQKNVIKRRRSGSKQFRYETIKSIEPAGQSQTFDIGLEDASEHNFVTDGIVVHNTGKTDLVCVEICYYLFTRKNMKILVAGPLKNHTEEIITRVRSFINSNPLLKNAVTRDVSSPYYEIRLKNGSRLRGYAGGSDTGGNRKGVSMRGQDADRIYLEEMDYIDEDAVTEAILPILMTTPDTALVGFSTPSGFRNLYYDLCQKNPYYVEFHHNYKVLPWYKNIEMERGNYTEEAWTHEYLAEFGETEAGVYKPSYVDRAMIHYDYEGLKRLPNWQYVVGTDWNEKHGTEIVVLGHNRFTSKFQIVETLHVERSEFTQLSGIAKLIEINRKWKPNYIYIDAGNGCLHKDSLVYCAEGIKRIEDVVVGDKVLSHNGVFKDVLAAVQTGVKNSYKIRPSFCLHTKASETHKHIVYRSKNKFHDFDNMKSSSEFCSSDLDLKEVITIELDKDKDFFLVPKQDISKKKDSLIIDLVKEIGHLPNMEYDDDFIWNKHSYPTTSSLSAKNITDKYGTSRATLQRTKRKLKEGIPLAPVEKTLAKQLLKDYGDNWYVTENKKISRYIDILDPDFLNLYGWYLSEGHAGVNNIEICQMPSHYRKEFSDLIDYCSSKWDTNVLTKKNGIRRLFILSSVLTELFKHIGGSHCYNKFIDKRILDNNGISLLPSLFWGDGHEYKRGVNLSLTSFTLTMQVRQMLINNGLMSGLHYVKPRKRTDGYKDSAPQMMLYLNSNKRNVNKINKILKTNTKARDGVYRRKYIEIDDCFLVPIKKIEHIGNTNDMYDLTVEGDSSFCVNGFATHNSTNYELLRHTSWKQREKLGDRDTARLLDILRKYDSGSSLTVKDPVSQQPHKTPAKPFMVNASVRMFEQDLIRFSSSDKTLESQLRNYVIERMTPSKVPVYGQLDKKIGDHKLDALNLAIVGFQLEFSDLHVSNVMINAGAAADPRLANNDKTIEEIKNRSDGPQERRLDSDFEKNWVEKNIFSSVPGRTSGTNSGIKTNRLGWATDDEEKEMAKFKHRRSQRNSPNHNKPKRTNI